MAHTIHRITAGVTLRTIIPGTRVGMILGTLDGTVLGAGIRPGIMAHGTGVGTTAPGIAPVGDGTMHGIMVGMAAIGTIGLELRQFVPLAPATDVPQV